MLIIDTGFLVALYIRRDKLHRQVLKFLQQSLFRLKWVATIEKYADNDIDFTDVAAVIY